MLRTDNARMPVRVDFLHDLMLVLIVAFPVFGTFFPFSTYVAAGQTGRDATVVLALILLTVLALFSKNPQKAILALRRSWLIFVFCFWALLTYSWAEVPSESFTRSGRLLVYALYGIYLVEMLEPRRSLRIMGFALLLALICSLLAIALLPGLATTTDARGILGTWRGAMAHKNSLGIMAGLGFLYGLIALKTHIFDRRLSMALVGISAVLLVLANSVTAVLGSLIVVGFLFYAFYMLPVVRDRVLAMLLVVVLVGVGVLCTYVLGSVLEAFGRDGTLTGRSSIWDYCNILITQNPFWGYGHGAWKFPLFQARALASLHWPIAHAHNTWLDLRVQLGLPGFILGVTLAALAAKNLFLLMFTSRMSDIVFPVSVFVLMGVRSYSETIVVDPALSDMFWFALAFSSFAKLASEERARRRQKRMKHVESGLIVRDMARRFGAEPLA